MEFIYFIWHFVDKKKLGLLQIYNYIFNLFGSKLLQKKSLRNKLTYKSQKKRKYFPILLNYHIIFTASTEYSYQSNTRFCQSLVKPEYLYVIQIQITNTRRITLTKKIQRFYKLILSRIVCKTYMQFFFT